MKVKNWHEFQHFKDRNPPWIKLHKRILEQRDISAISDRNFRVLVGLWLLASEDKDMQGNLPDMEDIAWRLRLDKSVISKALDELKPFLIQDDIAVISERYQDYDPEKRREEVEKSSELDFIEFWKIYPRKEAKKKSEQAWNNLTKEKKRKALSDITTRFRDTQTRFIPLATTYIHGERWEDTGPNVNKESYAAGAI